MVVRSYLSAKRHVVEGGFAHEIVWQASVGLTEPTHRSFMQEAAWVVLSAGMRESVIRSLFGRLGRALFDFDPSPLAADQHGARAAALAVFGHERKIDAILKIAVTVGGMGEDALRTILRADSEAFLCSLPYVGPVTWRHLAKNLGLPIAKPDRHMIRVAEATARPSVDALCDEIAGWLGEPVPVVDVVLWRWSVLHSRECKGSCTTVLHRPSS